MPQFASPRTHEPAPSCADDDDDDDDSDVAEDDDADNDDPGWPPGPARGVSAGCLRSAFQWPTAGRPAA